MTTPPGFDRPLSRLMVGTVQFGLPYGVANQTGQPSYKEVVEIVAAMIEGGVNCFDTAAAYGNSEEVLGRALIELGVMDRVTVVTKVRALTPTELADPSLAAKAIEQSVSESLRRLQLDVLPIVLFHREPDAIFHERLEVLRDRGWLKRYGVSCDNRPGPAAMFAASGFSALQLPANILDHRHQQSGIFKTAREHNVSIFIRSVYLQGLLLMPEDQIPQELRDVIPARRRLQDLAASSGMDLAELALRYMLSQDGVTSVIVGVETIRQAHDNCKLFARGPLPGDLLSAIDATQSTLSEAILTPNLWPKK